MNEITAREAQLRAILAPALDAYSARMSAHGHDVMNGGCTCGWKAPATSRAPRVSTGQHIKAQARKADALYSTEADAALAQARKDGAL